MLQNSQIGGLGAENHAGVGGGDVITKSQFGPTGRTSHPYSQHGSTRTTCDVSFKKPVEVAGSILEGCSASRQAQKSATWQVAAGGESVAVNPASRGQMMPNLASHACV